MFSKESKLKKLRHIVPLIPVYAIVSTVSFGFTKFILLNYNVNTLKYEELDGGFIYFIFHLLTTVLFYICAVMTVLTHIKTIITHPGKVSYEFIMSHKNNINPELYCKKCDIPRPERCHHCKTCNICILKFDHHCPWVANCIGLNNQKLFIQFLFFATLGDLIAFIRLIPRAFSIDLRVNSRAKEISDVIWLLKDKLILVIACMLAISMVIASGFLLSVQYELITNNVTTVETKKLQGRRGKYYDENRFNSFKIVMGANWKDWITPSAEISNIHNGYTYGKFNELNQGNVSSFYFDLNNSNINCSKTEDGFQYNTVNYNASGNLRNLHDIEKGHINLDSSHNSSDSNENE